MEKNFYLNESRIKINIQLFADSGDKTEKATSKKRQDARKKGQVLQSREISSALVLMLVFLGLKVLGGYIYTEILSYSRYILVEYPKIDDLFSKNMISKVFADMLIVTLKTTGPILGIALVTGLFINYTQVGFLFTLEPIKPQFSKINPLNGLKRIFSVKGLVELAKAVLKISIIGYVAYSYIVGESRNMMAIMDMEVINIAAYIGNVSLNAAIRICIVLIILGILDYAYQWWQFEKDLKMSKQEVKEEYKQVEGNPEIKSKIKQKQREISMRRMLSDVPKADVVITNPTHFAVAIKYDEKVSSAPIVTAKGQDFIALRIKEVAKENNIQIVENKPLARSLYSSVEIGDTIPSDLYQAVAEVLAFVYSLKR